MSAEKLSGLALSNLLKEDEDAADALCQRDANRPVSYGKHFALVSTPKSDRLDVIKKYNLDASLPVFFGDTKHVHVQNLGDILMQRGVAYPRGDSARNQVFLTLSEDGRFAGYCDSEHGYTSVMNVTSSDGFLRRVSVSCREKGPVVCMSIKDS